MYGIVYLITNTVTNKVYIGQTTLPLRKRWRAMVRAAEIGNKFNQDLIAAIIEYGSESFTAEELVDEYTRDELSYYERFYIQIYNSYDSRYGYNRSKGGFGAGTILDSTRDKYRKNCSPPTQLGKKRSEDTCRKISLAKKGIPLRRRA